MHNFKSIIFSILINFALINLALAANIPPNCPDPKVIQEQKWLGDIDCASDHCLYNMGGNADGLFAFGTQYYWHFYIDYKINSPEDLDFAKSKMVSTIDSLVYQSGPTEAGTPAIWDRYNPIQDENFNYTCLYSNNQGAVAKAVVTNVRIRPSDDDD